MINKIYKMVIPIANTNNCHKNNPIEKLFKFEFMKGGLVKNYKPLLTYNPLKHFLLF